MSLHKKILLPASLIAAILLARPPEATTEVLPPRGEPASISNAIKQIGSILKKGLSQLPSAAQAAAARQRAKTGQIADVSGEPPTLSTIATADIENIFWRPDVVSSIALGSASTTQCDEFYLGSTDNVSGGLRVCELAQGIGYSFGTLLNAEKTLCYMKALPNINNLRSGAVSIVKGQKRIPDRDFRKLFAPGAAPRVIKIHAPAIGEINSSSQNFFVRVLSKCAKFSCATPLPSRDLFVP